MAKTRVASASIEFTAEDAKFLASLRGIQRENKSLGTSFKELNRETQSVFGTQLEQKAHASAEAIKKVGGATKLTDAEAKAHLKTLDAWIIKSKALGRDVPDSILSTRAALANVNTEAGKSPGLFSSIGSSAVKMAGAMGIAFSAGAVISFTKGLADAAGEIVDLSAKTGLSTETIQRMQHVAKQTGTTLDGFTNAAFKLGVKLSGGGDSVKAAVADLGLEYQKLKAMRPDQQFELIAARLGEVKNEQDRNRMAVELFGKGAAEILPAIAQGYKKIAAGASIAKDEQLRALDEAGDAWDAFLERQKKGITGWLGNRVIIANQMRNLTEGEMARFMELHNEDANSAEAFLLKLARRKDINLPAPAGPSTSATTDYVAQLAQARAETEKLTTTQRAQIAAAEKMGATTEEITEQFKISEAALRLLNDTTKGATKAGNDRLELDKKIAAAQIPLTDVQKTRIDQLLKIGIGENDIAKKVGVSEIAVKKYNDTQKFLNATLKDRIALLPRLKQGFELGVGIPDASGVGAFNPDLINKKIPLRQKSSLFSAITENIGSVFAGMDASSIGAIQAINRVKAGLQKGISNKPTFFESAFGTSDQLGQQLASTVIGAIQGGGNPISAAAGSIGSSLMSGLAKNLTTAKDGTKAVLSGWIGGAANAVLPFVGSLVGPLVDGIFGAFRDKAHEKTNDLRDQFLLQFGSGGTGVTSGFGALAAQLAKIDGGSAAFKALIDAKSPEAFARAMERVNTILASTPEALANAAGFQTKAQLQEIAANAVKLHASMRDSGLFTAEAVQTAWERAQAALIAAGDKSAMAAEKARGEIAKLKTELDGLQASVDAEAEEEVMGEEEKRNRGRIAQIKDEMKAREEQIAAEMAAREEAADAAAASGAAALDTIKSGASDLYAHIDDVFGKGFTIPVEWAVGGVPTSYASRGGLVGSREVQYLAAGGSVFGSPRGTDTVPARLTPGEGILNVSAMDLIGVDALRQLNAGRVPAALRSSPVSASSSVGSSERVTHVSVDARGSYFDSRDAADTLAVKIAKAIHGGGEVLDSWKRNAMPLLVPSGA